MWWVQAGFEKGNCSHVILDSVRVKTSCSTYRESDHGWTEKGSWTGTGDWSEDDRLCILH